MLPSQTWQARREARTGITAVASLASDILTEMGA